jgi:diguanylate cyclase
MAQENLMQEKLEGIRHLLSHLQGEVLALEQNTSQVLLALQRLEHLAGVDELTGLLRRNAFFHQWKGILKECAELQEVTGVLMVDIDHFKSINDRHGHLTGDEVLSRVGGMLKTFCSGSVVAGRLGGEEFAVAVRGTEAQVVGMAEMIRRGAERLHGPVIAEGGVPNPKVEWRCTLSVGVAIAPATPASGTTSPEQEVTVLLEAADRALYEAKQKGRNQVRVAA